MKSPMRMRLVNVEVWKLAWTDALRGYQPLLNTYTDKTKLV